VRVVALLSALLVVTLTGCSSQHNDAPSSTPTVSVATTPSGRSSNGATQVVHYTPFTAQGTVKLDLKITKIDHGTCSHRKDDDRADMFDCTVPTANGTSESGPCFYGSHTTGLVCTGGPQAPTAFEVIPNAPFVPPPGPFPAVSTTPFALTMSNGKLCVPFHVKDSEVLGVSLTYICVRGKSTPTSRLSAI
jgi:hypothetical protein